MTGMLQFEDPLLAARFVANHAWVNPVDPDAERKAFADHLFAFMKKRKCVVQYCSYKYKYHLFWSCAVDRKISNLVSH